MIRPGHLHDSRHRYRRLHPARSVDVSYPLAVGIPTTRPFVSIRPTRNPPHVQRPWVHPSSRTTHDVHRRGQALRLHISAKCTTMCIRNAPRLGATANVLLWSLLQNARMPLMKTESLQILVQFRISISCNLCKLKGKYKRIAPKIRQDRDLRRTFLASQARLSRPSPAVCPCFGMLGEGTPTPKLRITNHILRDTPCNFRTH